MQPRPPIHVLDGDHDRRDQIVRCAYALGHHAEVFSDPAELLAFAPEGGVVVALEGAVHGGVPGLMGLLNREGRWLAVIVTSSTPSIAKAVQAIRHGALDFLPLPFDEQNLSLAITKASAEAEFRRHRQMRQSAARTRLARLSAREREVVEWMAKGLTNKEMGRELDISPRTVEIHRTNALSKLAARHSAEAIRLCLEGSDEFATFDDLPIAV